MTFSFLGRNLGAMAEESQMDEVENVQPAESSNQVTAGAAPPTAENEDNITATAKKEKKEPYVNPDRVQTGGQQRVRITTNIVEAFVTIEETVQPYRLE